MPSATIASAVSFTSIGVKPFKLNQATVAHAVKQENNMTRGKFGTESLSALLSRARSSDTTLCDAANTRSTVCRCI